MAKTGRESFKFMLRLPDELRDVLREQAESNGRSVTAEIIHRLEGSFCSVSVPADLRQQLTVAATNNSWSLDAEINDRLERSFDVWPVVSLPSHMVARGLAAPQDLRLKYELELDNFAEELFQRRFPSTRELILRIENEFRQIIRDNSAGNEDEILEEFFSFYIPFMKKLGPQKSTDAAYFRGAAAARFPEKGIVNPYAKSDDNHAAWDLGYEESRQIIDSLDSKGDNL